MATHLQREIDQLKRKLLGLSAVVEENVERSVRALMARDAELAAEAVRLDDEMVDVGEVEVEEECLKVLALHQPVASDLRFIVAVIKINGDLERVGDLAVNIAERAAFLAGDRLSRAPFDLRPMCAMAQSMLKRSLDALVNASPDAAREVLAQDDSLDDLNRQNYQAIQERMHSHPEEIGPLMHYLAVSRHLERIGDHATNIAEDVVYIVEGEIVRHRATDFQSQC